MPAAKQAGDNIELRFPQSPDDDECKKLSKDANLEQEVPLLSEFLP